MKKVLLIVLPILLIVGVVLGLGFAGIINIPGITKKKKAKAPLVAAKTAPKVAKAEARKAAETPKATKPVSFKVVTPPPDLVQGDRKLAEVWAEMDPTQLAKIIDDWKDQDLARVLVLMDADKVTALLAVMDSKRASLLSREIQKKASEVVAKTST